MAGGGTVAGFRVGVELVVGLDLVVREVATKGLWVWRVGLVLEISRRNERRGGSGSDTGVLFLDLFHFDIAEGGVGGDAPGVAL